MWIDTNAPLGQWVLAQWPGGIPMMAMWNGVTWAVDYGGRPGRTGIAPAQWMEIPAWCEPPSQDMQDLISTLKYDSLAIAKSHPHWPDVSFLDAIKPLYNEHDGVMPPHIRVAVYTEFMRRMT